MTKGWNTKDIDKHIILSYYWKSSFVYSYILGLCVFILTSVF
jgi:hypothetical protein